MLSADSVYWFLLVGLSVVGAAYLWLSRETPRAAMAAPAAPAPKPKPVPVDLKVAGASAAGCRRVC